MREFLLDLKTEPFDSLYFWHDSDGDACAGTLTLKDRGEELPGSSLGKLYDILIFPIKNPPDVDRFKSILISPLEYISRMLDSGFSGLTTIATTTTDDFMASVQTLIIDSKGEKCLNDLL